MMNRKLVMKLLCHNKIMARIVFANPGHIGNQFISRGHGSGLRGHVRGLC